VSENELKLIAFAHLLAEFNTDLVAHGLPWFSFTMDDFALCTKHGAEDLSQFSNYWYKDPSKKPSNTLTGKSQMRNNPPPQVISAKVRSQLLQSRTVNNSL
jgi:hypothetical protein